MRNILIPIDGTERSMKAVDLVKSLYMPKDVNIVLLMVREDIASMFSAKEFDKIKKEMKSTLDAVSDQMPGFQVKKEVVIGRAGEGILDCANQNNIDIIVMTKSTKDGWSQMIGSVASYVVKYASCIVMIVPENGSYERLNRKLVRCKHMDDIVTLAGQASLKTSTCYLPVQAGICSYFITVLEGKMRLNHLAFNPDGNMWNLPPQNKQPDHYDLKKGEEKEIQVEILVCYDHLDQIKVVNPSMTEPLKFHYIARFENTEN
ncbi:universal stress protein [Caproiciproducens galactitolivorans]|uniref:Universal stress protein family protein n=1 Tax=Caproiciproducens galactitolivorans TaxID=642589 RepID=A0A4Z0YBU0_9FIRM|nr:universal stress protein [Caproiciproducens galactitolivorans]TGJ76711.1 universal stress protein family protein [Caproiciproducens galactitolivorans]